MRVLASAEDMDVAMLLNPRPHPHASLPVPLPLPPSPVASPQPVPQPQKRRVLRATGQAHRDRERECMDELLASVKALKLDNRDLLAQCKALVLNVAEPHTLRDALRDEAAAGAAATPAPAGYRLSAVLAAHIGVRYITGAMALLMLEVIAGRRKLPAAAATGRSSTAPQPATAATAEQGRAFCAIFNRALHDVRRDAQRLAALYRLEPLLCELELRTILIDLHCRWADAEGVQLAPPTIATSHLRSRTPIAKKHSRPKKCHRCGKLRSAGFGHPRSICNKPEAPLSDASGDGDPAFCKIAM